MLSSLWEHISSVASGIWESVAGFFEADEGERELVDEEISLVSPEEVYDVALVELEEAREDAIYNEEAEAEAEAEEAIAELEEAPLFVEEEEPLSREDWPGWITDAEVEVMREEFGVTSYDDLYDFEKDEWLPGWRGFEAADQPAGEIEDIEEFREMVLDEFGLMEEHNLSDAEMMTLLMISANQETYKEMFEAGLEEDEIAEELEIEYRMTFESLDWFLGSATWDFALQRPDLYEIYIGPDGEVYVFEVY